MVRNWCRCTLSDLLLRQTAARRHINMCSLSFILAFSILTLFSFADGVLQATDPDYQAEDARLSDVVKIKPELCGNGRKDPGEECDCGSPEKCRHDPCCHSTCQLKLHSQCSNSEPCCEKCKFKSPGSVCKEAKNNCDVTLYCSGESGACPFELAAFKRNGASCTDDSGPTVRMQMKKVAIGVCYNGTCNLFHQPCEDNWKTSETEPIKEKSKCLGNMVCVNKTCTKLSDLPHSKPCDTRGTSGRECSDHGVCTNLGCYCYVGWTGSDCWDARDITLEDDKPGKVKGIGPEQTDSTSNTPALVGGLVTFVIVVSIIFVVMAFRFIPSKAPKDNNTTSMYPHAQLETVDSDGPNVSNTIPTT